MAAVDHGAGGIGPEHCGCLTWAGHRHSVDGRPDWPTHSEPLGQEADSRCRAVQDEY